MPADPAVCAAAMHNASAPSLAAPPRCCGRWVVARGRRCVWAGQGGAAQVRLHRRERGQPGRELVKGLIPAVDSTQPLHPTASAAASLPNLRHRMSDALLYASPRRCRAAAVLLKAAGAVEDRRAGQYVQGHRWLPLMRTQFHPSFLTAKGRGRLQNWAVELHWADRLPSDRTQLMVPTSRLMQPRKWSATPNTLVLHI